ncbi:hypothetical protein I4U23_011237 [Adineta vaga]|nr:hypothetical protein I4U23_011237 [Adineta vaga]
MDDLETTILISSIFAILCIMINLFILILIYRTKPRLHTVNHLLISNTSFISIFYSIMFLIDYIYMIFIISDTSHLTCRFRSYFTYVSIGELMHSIMIQAISRFFFVILSTKYRWLTTIQTHYILISTQWLIVLFLTLPILIFDTARFYPRSFCWIIPEYNNIDLYLFVINFILPFLTVIFVYFYILNRVHKIKRNQIIMSNSIQHQKRDLIILRNTMILISIGLMASIPNIILSIHYYDIIYSIHLVCLTFSVTLVALCNVLLDREIRQTIQTYFQRQTIQVTRIQIINVKEREMQIFSKRTNNHS